MIQHCFGAIRLAVCSILICAGIYPVVIWGAGRLLCPDQAAGQLVRDDTGKLVGSLLIGQNFTLDRYFHPRPSAVAYNGAGSGGSNLSPASDKLRERAKTLIIRYGATALRPLPADLATASGSGLDPDITLASARFQMERVAKARHVSAETIGKIVEESVYYPGGLPASEPLVNVLQLNLKLDRLN